MPAVRTCGGHLEQAGDLFPDTVSICFPWLPGRSGSQSALGRRMLTRQIWPRCGSMREPDYDQLDRLRWQCRRGMLEVDLLLNRFLETVYPTLTGQDKQLFANLLEYPDQVLLEWLMGRERPLDGRLARVVDRIRDTFTP